MTNKVTDLRSYKFAKTVDTFMGAVGGIYHSEKNFFETGKFLPFADSYAESGFKEEYRPRFYVSIDFRDYKPSEDAQALLRRLKADRFEIEKRKFARAYLPRSGGNRMQGILTDRWLRRSFPSTKLAGSGPPGPPASSEPTSPAQADFALSAQRTGTSAALVST